VHTRDSASSRLTSIFAQTSSARNCSKMMARPVKAKRVRDNTELVPAVASAVMGAYIALAPWSVEVDVWSGPCRASGRH
jgi:hypothetical protein